AGSTRALRQPTARDADLARRCIARSQYPGDAPTIEQHTADRLPLDDAAVDLAVVPSELDTHPNPVRLLAELGRIVRPGGFAVLILPPPSVVHPVGMGGHGYRPHELIAQVRAVGGLEPASDPRQTKPGQPMVLVMQRTAEASGATPAVASVAAAGAR
ncbi:MAG: methyltransferase domain-containing protein, partial [Phycisphaeraceae bacterium]